MDMSMERDSSVLGSLFQQIINDMKNTSPLWEDFVAKASKLHACLRAAIQAIAAYLDAFQKIADAATNSRGASKEIGTALTRVCLRHKAVETRLKTFTAAIMDCLVQPLQDKLEDWKRSVATIDKEHAKEYKRCRTELKKRSTDTLRLQKKARKGQSDTLQSLMDSHMQDVSLRRAELEEVEKKSLRSVMIEERMRYCNFVHMLQPVVKEECEVMSELSHLQEAMQSIALVTKEPHVLPAASEELIHDAKASITLYPDSPSASVGGSLSQGGCSNSLGSRKSSVCSISSMNSTGSSNSPGHPHYPRSLSQLISPSIRLKPGESSDSGFCSSPALTTQASSIANPSHAVTTWPTHAQDVVDLAPNATDRPHTISTAYEKGHQRPPLTVYTFQNPETIHEGGGGTPTTTTAHNSGGSSSGQNTPSTQKSPAGALNRPPLPVRCSSLERPLAANANRTSGNGSNIMQRQCPSPIPAHVTKELAAHLAQQQHHQQLQQQQQQQQQQQHLQQQQATTPNSSGGHALLGSPPTYVNMSELANMAAMKINNMQQQQQQLQQQQQQQQQSSSSSPPLLQQQHSIDSISSIQSNDSNQQVSSSPHHHNQNPPTPKTQRSQSSTSTNSPSLHSHPSIDSTVATPPIGQTPSVSSGSSTPQNHYSPLLNNSMSSTAAGTPSGSSIASGIMSTSGGTTGGIDRGGSALGGGNNFVYNVCSPTPPLSANSSQASDVLKITEIEGNPNSPPQMSTNNNSATPNNNQQNQIESTIETTDKNSSPSTTSGNIQEISTPYATDAIDDSSAAGTVIENDERSRASVLQKASMFEKQAAAAVKNSASNNAPAGIVLARHSPAGDSGIYGIRSANNSHHSAHQHQHQAGQSTQTIDPQDVDKCFEDSLQELNNLIGELDSFQREIDASKLQQQQQQQESKQHPKNVKNLYDDLEEDDAFNCNETMTIITDENTTTIICESSSQQQLQQHQVDKDFCTASNQTNSSGCGTDISDTTSEDCNADTRSLTSQTGGVLLKNNLKTLSGGAYNSDSELSRCYVSETSSIMGGTGDGYENPTFAHFAISSGGVSSQCYDDNRSDTLSLQRLAVYGDNLSDSGSNVVVIYDHQPPITPDIDYVKQNSEIVMLRTKPQQHQMGGLYGQQEMRELQQLPDNLSEAPVSPPDSREHPPHIATVQPAKQRLSSFRASSEQLQLLTSGQQQHSTFSSKGMHTNHSNTKRNSCGPSTTTNTAINGQSFGDNHHLHLNHQQQPQHGNGSAALANRPTSDSILRKKLPPKPPSLTVFQESSNSLGEAINGVGGAGGAGGGSGASSTQRRSIKSMQPIVPGMSKLDFKSDLEAKILKQKEKLKKQQKDQEIQNQNHHQQQKIQLKIGQQQILQQQQQQQHYQQQQQQTPTTTPSLAQEQQQTQTSCSNNNNSHLNHPSINCNSNSNSKKSSLKSLDTCQEMADTLPSLSASSSTSSSSSSSNSPPSSASASSSSPSSMSSYASNNSHSNNDCNVNQTFASSSSNNPPTHNNTHHQSIIQQQQHNLIIASSTSISSTHTSIYTKTSLTNPLKSSSLATTSSLSVVTSSSSLNVITPPLPPPLPPSKNSKHINYPYQDVSFNVRSSQASSVSLVATVAKPSITPRPASLSSGSTRIARRSSVNTAKPPPPVRRSSSVTPSPNTPTTPTNSSATSLLHQHTQSLNTSTENLPPPPAYLLDGRQQIMTATTPPNGMPNSSQKVSDTVKALAAGLRHQSASPQTLRRLQQQQQQQQVQQMPNSPQQPVVSAQQQHSSMLQSPIHHHHEQHNHYAPSSPIILPMHDEPDYDANYDTYVEVLPYNARNIALAQMAHLTPSNIAKVDSCSTTCSNNSSVMSNYVSNQLTIPIYQQPPKQYHHQYTKSSPAMLSPTTTKKSIGRMTPQSNIRSMPQYILENERRDDIPPPLPPPNPNSPYPPPQHQQQSSLQMRYQQQQYHQQLQNNHQHLSQEQQQLGQQHQQQQAYYCNNGESVYDRNSPTSFRTSSPGGIYAQPKILNNMSSFRTPSPGPNGHQTPTQSHVPAQPKTNPNLIAQLNARLNSKQQTQNTANEAIYGVSQPQKEDIYMRNYGQQSQQQQQQQQRQMSPHTSQQQQQQTYDAGSSYLS